MLYPPGRGPKGTGHQALGKETCIKPVLIAQFTSSCLQDRCPRAVVPKLGCSVESPRELVKMQIPAPQPGMLIHETGGQVTLSQTYGSQGRLWSNSVLRKNIWEMPCAWEPRRRCGETSSWPFLPDSCSPWQVITWDVKRDFFLWSGHSFLIFCF